jgi:hypothetical protein
VFRHSPLIALVIAMTTLPTACCHLPMRSRSAAALAPRPGQLLPPETDPVELVHRGGELCSHELVLQGVKFNLDVECGRNVILYVQTFDPMFVTPEGLSMGATLRDAVGEGGSLLAGDECGVLLPSGWIARPRTDPTAGNPGRAGCVGILDAEVGYFDTEFIGGGA